MTGHNAPAEGDRPEEEPVPDARRLQEELEAARRAGQAVPYETLAALAASVGDLRSQVRFVHSVVDRSGLAFAKDTRALVLRLTATVDAMDAKLADLAQAVQDLQDSGSRVSAPNWAAMDQATRAAELAKLAEWVARVLLPGYRVDPPLRPCWRAHLPGGVGAGDRLGRVAPGVRPQGTRAGGRSRLAQPLAPRRPGALPARPVRVYGAPVHPGRQRGGPASPVGPSSPSSAQGPPEPDRPGGPRVPGYCPILRVAS